jgi:hypothetical protein
MFRERDGCAMIVVAVLGAALLAVGIYYALLAALIVLAVMALWWVLVWAIDRATRHL